ncbi:hypothetical protein MG293_004004 [Ovis ammon polii]|uniref:Uncharacterized protein n=1 Tax=Ovis ammon polii TaxID=230172 RepID=A0AAD4YGM2_OVIAM|nr:hypothetical protein MG293_004004 [Ovis ammon polii]KAI4577590.1 hypothetical protein MJT46_003425 [Ovis ammon polii x Ovis aries]
MTEGTKKPSKKFKFFKFKGFGSLSNLPRSFTLKRSLAPNSIRPQVEADTFDATQDDMVTVPKSPAAYARSSDMYSHMGTMPRPSIKKAQGKRATQKAQEVGPEPQVVPRSLPDPPAAEKVVLETTASREDTPTVGPSPSAVEVDPTRKPEDARPDAEEERDPKNVPSERTTAEPEAGGDYVKSVNDIPHFPEECLIPSQR